MDYLKKSFKVSTFPRADEESVLEKEGYEKRNGYWVKCKIPAECLVPKSCSRCGKITGGDWDAPCLDDWHLCKNCFIEKIQGREERLIREAVVIISNGHIQGPEVDEAMKFLELRGTKRWIKINWPDEYKEIYEGEE